MCLPWRSIPGHFALEPEHRLQRLALFDRPAQLGHHPDREGQEPGDQEADAEFPPDHLPSCPVIDRSGEREEDSEEEEAEQEPASGRRDLDLQRPERKGEHDHDCHRGDPDERQPVALHQSFPEDRLRLIEDHTWCADDRGARLQENLHRTNIPPHCRVALPVEMAAAPADVQNHST
jgi:hypothetical protein